MVSFKDLKPRPVDMAPPLTQEELERGTPFSWWENVLRRCGKPVHVFIEPVSFGRRFVTVDAGTVKECAEYQTKYNVHIDYALWGFLRLPRTAGRVTERRLLSAHQVRGLSLPRVHTTAPLDLFPH